MPPTTSKTADKTASAAAEPQTDTTTAAGGTGADTGHTDTPVLRNGAESEDGTLPPRNAEERQFRAEMIVKEHMIASLGLGLIPIPLLDIATGVASNVVLVNRLCALYDQPFKASVARGAILTLMAALGSVGAAVTVGFSLAKLVPGIGTAAGTVTLPIANAATSYVIGKMFIGHFEMGGTLFDFDPRSNVPQAQAAYAKGRDMASDLFASRRKTSTRQRPPRLDAAAATA